MSNVRAKSDGYYHFSFKVRKDNKKILKQLKKVADMDYYIEYLVNRDIEDENAYKEIVRDLKKLQQSIK